MSITTAPSYTTSGSPMSSATNPTLLALPPEILLQTFLNLTSTPSSLLALQLTCSYMHTLISGSSQLRYEAALIATHQVDNPYLGQGGIGTRSAIPVREKLEWMRESSRRWSILDLGDDPEGEDEGKAKVNLKHKRTRQIKVNHVPSGIYDLTGGVYLLGDLPRKCLYWVKLPGREEIMEGKETTWNKIDLDALRKRADSDGRERTMIDMGMCIYEHDLIAIVTLSPQPTPDRSPPSTNDIDLVFLQFSTGLPHPALAKPKASGPTQTQAQNYVRHVTSSPVEWHRPAVGIEIVGEHLVLVLYYHSGSAEDRVYVWEWKTGVLKMSLTAPRQTYSGLIFLTPSLILLPNAQTNALDIFYIPSKPIYTPAEPILSLDLPRLAGGRTLAGISCRAEPNPIGAAPPSNASSSSGAPTASFSESKNNDDNPDEGTQPVDLTPTRPFLPSAEHAICIFSLRVLGGGFPLLNLHFGHTFTFVVHRRAFVDIVEREVPGYDKEEAGEKAEFEEQGEEGARGGVHPTPDTDAGAGASVESQDADEDHGPAMPGSFSSFIHNPSSGTRRKSLPYASWGPPITRWFNSDSIPTRWITTTCGQRLVLTADSGNSEEDQDGTAGFPYVVLDFNQESVRRLGGRLKVEWEAENRRREEAQMKMKEKAREVMLRRKEKERERRGGKQRNRREAREDVLQRMERIEREEQQSGMSVGGSEVDMGEAGPAPGPGPSTSTSAYLAGPSSFSAAGAAMYEDLLAAAGVNREGANEDEDDSDADDGLNDEDGWELANNDDDDDDDDDDDGYLNLELGVSARAGAALHGLNLPDDDDDDMDDDDDHGVALYTTDTDAQTRTHTGSAGEYMDIDLDIEEEEEEEEDVAAPEDQDQGDIEWFAYAPEDLDVEAATAPSHSPELEPGPSHQVQAILEHPNPDPDPHPQEPPNSNDHQPAPTAPSLPLHRLWHVTSSEPLEPIDAFAERVEGRLPYVACASERRYRFEGVLVDEERVVGITTDMFDRVKQIDVHYFG